MFAGSLDIIKFLIEKGADVNAKNEAGETALKIAKENKNEKIIKLLKENGAKEE